MKRVAGLLLFGFVMGLPAHAQTSIFLEDFSGGSADWRAEDYTTTATYNASGGHDGGDYISISYDIDTSSNGAQGLGGYVTHRCPSGAPSGPAVGINCSGGGFTGDWYLTGGVQTVRFWFRHNSAKPGGLIPIVRIAIPFNSPGGSATFAAVPANTWTLLSAPLDTQDPIWDPAWGAGVPDAVGVFTNVGRIQPGIFVEPADPDYFENGVTLDIDDVEILGTTSLTAQVVVPGQLHPRHDGPLAATGLNDDVRVRVLGSSTAAGDPVDIDTDDIIAASVRLGRIGGDGTGTSGTPAVYNQNFDSDGLDDAQFRSLMSNALGTRDAAFPTFTGNCTGSPLAPNFSSVELRAELTTGEVIAGEDTSINSNCEAACHL